MKPFIPIFLALPLFFISLAAAAQNNIVINNDGRVVVAPSWYDHAKEGENNLFFSNPVVSRSNGCGDPHYKPAIGYHFSGDSITPRGEHHYECDEHGVVKKMTRTNYNNNDVVLSYFNGTYTAENQNIYDTVTLYVVNDDVWTPRQRNFYSYHLSEPGENGFYYTDMTSQVWNASAGTWQNFFRESWFFANPTSGHISAIITAFADEKGDFSIFSEAGTLKDSLIYDEAGNVKWRIIYVIENNEFVETGNRFEYFYREDGGPYHQSIIYYSDKRGDAWEPDVKRSECINIEWYEWNGFKDEANFLFTVNESPAVKYYHNTMSKVLSYDSYSVRETGGDWRLTFSNKLAWNMDGTRTHVDSVYYYGATEELESCQTYHNHYNSCGDYIGTLSHILSYEPEPHVETFFGTWHNIEYNEYGKERQFTYVINDMVFEILSGEIIDSFAPVSITEIAPNPYRISITPNPASGQTRIAAEEIIREVEVFDMTGRLVKTQTINNNEATLMLEGFPKGLYILKALMKTGEKQVGKLLLQ